MNEFQNFLLMNLSRFTPLNLNLKCNLNIVLTYFTRYADNNINITVYQRCRVWPYGNLKYLNNRIDT